MILPGVYQLVNGEVKASKLRPVNIDDLLGRDEVHVNLNEVMDYVSGRVIMVTGGGGSIGSELCRQIAKHSPKQLIIFDIYENNAYDIQQELLREQPKLDLVVLIGSVRDENRINSIFEQYRPEIIYHAAAHKHVPLMEGSPNEAIKNNVLGTYNAEFVLGETKLTILDETGIPTDTKRVEVIRGSYKRGALKGAIIGCVILLLYVLSRRTVKSRKDLKKNINLQDLGSIPYVRTKKRKKETFYNSVSLLNERISMSYLEAIRKLRIRVMKDMEKKEYQTLLVTSSIPGEGKTTLSANLAISIAQQGKKVLLVDCDLRNPSIAGVMNEQEPHPGLGSVLKKEVPLSEAITNVKLPKERTNENGSLHVIFGGAPDGENSLLIGSGRMRALIKALKSKYDIIILDTAPSELLADAPLLGKYVDAALYVIRYDYTKLREIREGVESLALSGIDMLGYVFNGDNSSGGQGYGYGYRRYGNYGSYGSHYGSYGKYGAYGHYGKMEKGSTDKFGRVIKD